MSAYLWIQVSFLTIFHFCRSSTQLLCKIHVSDPLQDPFLRNLQDPCRSRSRSRSFRTPSPMSLPKPNPNPKSKSNQLGNGRGTYWPGLLGKIIFTHGIFTNKNKGRTFWVLTHNPTGCFRMLMKSINQYWRRTAETHWGRERDDTWT